MAEPAMAFDRAELEEGIPARFDKVVREHATHLAIGGVRPWTYGDIEQRTNQLARAILDRTQPGRGCVAYLVDHSPEMVICALAALKAAKAFLCIHPAMPAKAQRDIVSDAAPDLLLADAAHATAAHELVDDDSRLLLLDEIDERYSADALHVAIDPGDPAAIFYTSGSTGRPKGVVKSHRAVLHRAWLCARYDGVNAADRQSLLTYCSFASSEADVFGALLNGATLELYDAASRGLGDLGAWIDARRITLFHPPVMLFRKYLEMIEGSGLHPSVRLVALAGQTVIGSDIEQWRHRFARSCALRHRFSSTEAGHIAVASVAPGETLAPGTVPPPRAVADKSLLIVDEEGQPVEQGSVGELVVRSAFLADGYWRQASETAKYFRNDLDFPGQHLFHTGDIGHLSGDGRFEFIGRRDDQVKVRGYRVETREIEQALMLLPTVSEAAVVTELRQDAHQLAAFVVMEPGALFQAESLRAGLRPILPQWKIPGRIHALETLPLTATGKIDRPLLQQYLQARRLAETGDDAPDRNADGLTARLIKIWQGLFGRPRNW
jgi:amino acid adenylation domain-containing protein